MLYEGHQIVSYQTCNNAKESIQINKDVCVNSQSDLGINKNTYPTTIGTADANK